MRFVIQRVKEASVVSEDVVLGKIGLGYLVLTGISAEDNEQIADKMIKKMLGLRIFADAEGKTNLSLETVGGSLLIVSQFTLYADCRKGNRPGFTNAAGPEHAEKLYEYIVDVCRRQCPDVQTGSFGADMQVSLVNDGPFTVVLDSKELF